MKAGLWIGLLFLLHSGLAQQVITVVPTFNQEPVALGKNYYSKALSDSISFDRIKFYLSSIRLDPDTASYSSPNLQYHLVDLEKPASQMIVLPMAIPQTAKGIQFLLGVDSTTQVAGALGGDLDPTQGMYWSWQSGYIHVKIEGRTPVCPARNHRFQFHLGGYQSPFNTVQLITLPVNSHKSFAIEIPLDQFFGDLDIRSSYQVMSPGTLAVDLAKQFAATFKVVQ